MKAEAGMVKNAEAGAKPAEKTEKRKHKENLRESTGGKPAPKAAEKPKEKPTGKGAAFDPWKALLYPHLAEKSMGMVEFQNKLTFVVRKDANKREIKEAVERGFGVEVTGVNVEVTMKGVKKAYVTLSPKSQAADIATRLGMI